MMTSVELEKQRRAIIRAAIEGTGFTQGEVFGRGKSKGLHIVRTRIALELRRIGLSTTRIGQIMGRRDHTTILNYFGNSASRKGQRYTHRRIFRHLSSGQCEVITAIAKAEDTSIEALMAQWVGERADCEMKAKARAA